MKEAKKSFVLKSKLAIGLVPEWNEHKVSYERERERGRDFF
jgi:hypothetical protein